MCLRRRQRANGRVGAEHERHIISVFVGGLVAQHPQSAIPAGREDARTRRLLLASSGDGEGPGGSSSPPRAAEKTPFGSSRTGPWERMDPIDETLALVECHVTAA